MGISAGGLPDGALGADDHRRSGSPTLSVIAPAYNERANIRPLVAAVALALEGISWEIVIVDDDSPDGTAQEAFALAHEGYPVRCIRRVGRRGLASAVVEGALAASGHFIAVIDADMQHDERVLPQMLAILQAKEADVVIGSRHVDGGSIGDWSAGRAKMSSLATRIAKATLGTEIGDPMSGFFAIRRDTFHACVYDLSQQGYKILLDILSSSPRALKVVEVPYVFKNRVAGDSKIDVMVLAEFAFLIIEKLTKGVIPPRFVLFSLVGGLGLLIHLATLSILEAASYGFIWSQAAATLVAMLANYFINNNFTYRSQRLKGVRALRGLLVFCLICSFGAIANVGVADLVLTGSGSWPIAGIAGAVMSAVFNFGAATQLVWNTRRRRAPLIVTEEAPPRAG